jgi:hypothetical protein
MIASLSNCTSKPTRSASAFPLRSSADLRVLCGEKSKLRFQNDAEACLVGNHPLIGLGGFRQRELFDHRAYPG